MKKRGKLLSLSLSLSRKPLTFKLENKQLNKPQNSHGFTIVELLVVIVVIGILAAITIVSYTGISNRATVAAVQSDLDSAGRKLKLYYTLYGSYPTAMDGNNCPTAPNADTNYCLQSSNGSTLAYNSVAPTTFRLTDTKSFTSYSVTDNSTPSVATTVNGSTTGNACPTGYIPVPGSGTYGTNDFCVMKYEAKNVGGVATSQAASTPWVSISQTTAITTAASACSGCHLITEAEWLTIAQNVLSVASNWSGASVGSGYIYSGHNDNAPANTLAADANDANGYSGETNVGGNQKRTLTLTNGQVIWDMSGNATEWTTGVTTGNQPGTVGNNYSPWAEWNATPVHGSLSPDPFPSTTGIVGSGSWTSAQGIGPLLSKTNEATARAYRRSGPWNDFSNDGILSLRMDAAPSDAPGDCGFRVSR